MGTKINVHLSATLLSKGDDRYLVTSTQEGDVPIALEVDGATARALLNLSRVYNRMPEQLLDLVMHNSGMLVRIVRSFRAEFRGVQKPPQWSSVPMIGITDKIEHTNENGDVLMYEVKYLKTGDAIRFVYGFLDPATYSALHTIITAYESEPDLWHYVLQKYWKRLELFVSK